jgi:hypothetical protein
VVDDLMASSNGLTVRPGILGHELADRDEAGRNPSFAEEMEKFWKGVGVGLVVEVEGQRQQASRGR